MKQMMSENSKFWYKQFIFQKQ